MAWGTPFRSSLAGLLFTATAITGVADNAASSPITNVHIALHTADPVAGNQTTSESAYTSYARQPVVRTTTGWTDTAGVVTNDAEILFPAATGGTSTVTHVSTGTLLSGAGVIWVPGAVSSSLAVSTGIQPRFAISALSITIA